MRCPKCGYISFDHLETCLKCNKNVSKAASQVEGTTYHVQAPSFLRVSKDTEADIDEDTEILFEGGKEDFELVDQDLDILVDAEEVDIDDIGISLEDDLEGIDDLGEDEAFEFTLDEEGGDGDAGIDLGQFEDAFEGEDAFEKDVFGESEVQLDLPDELNDISDLSSPAGGTKVDELDLDSPIGKAIDEEPPASGPESDDFSFNLDLDDLGDDFSLTTPDEAAQEGGDDASLDSLSLDDIGLSTPEEETSKRKKTDRSGTDMDGDLDFDLDLGGLSLTDD